jgi:hypothetical protein
MKTYFITLETSITVEAEDEDQAEQLAYDGDLEDYDGWTLVYMREIEDES